MGIKIFFKHLFTSMGKRPVQPIVLTIVIAFAVVVCILASSIIDYNIEENTLKNEAQNGVANIAITPGYNSESRFLDPDKAREILENGGYESSACGAYAVPFYFGDNKDFTYGVITDVESAAEIFDLPDELPIKRRDKRKTVCISRDFAEEHSLSVGDAVTFSILGTECEFTVMSINEKPIMGQYDVMVDAVAVLNMIEGGGTLEDVFMPYGKLFIKVNGDSETVNDAIKLLDKEYANVSVEGIVISLDYTKENMEVILTLFVLITVLLTMLTLFSCFSVLSAQRADENALFYSVGTKSYMLNLLSAAELFVYWFIGVAMGIALSYPMSQLMIKTAGLIYVKPTINVEKSSLIALVMLITTEFSNAVHIIDSEVKKRKTRNKKAERKNKGLINSIVLVALVVLIGVSVAMIFIVEYHNREYPAIVAEILTIFAIFYVGKTFFPKLAKRLDRHSFKNAYVRYAVKNSARVASQANAAGLVAAITTIMVFAFCLAMVCSLTETHYKTIIQGDYIIVGATANTRENIANLEGCESVHQASVYTVTNYVGMDFTLIAADSPDVFTPKYRLDTLPEGNNIYMNNMTFQSWYWDCMGKKIPFFLNGVMYDNLVLTGTIYANERTIMVDAEALGLDYNYTVVTAKEGYDKVQFRQEIFESCDTDYIVIMDAEDATGELINNISLYTTCLYVVVVEIMAFAIIGLLDSIISGFKSRAEEFDCYMGAGMTKKDIRKMKLCECAGIFVFGLIMVAIMLAFVMFILHEILIGSSVDILNLF